MAVIPFAYYDPSAAALRALANAAINSILDDRSIAAKTRARLLETLKDLHA